MLASAIDCHLANIIDNDVSNNNYSEHAKTDYVNLTDYVDSLLSKFIPAYRKSYSSNHVLIRLIENWKKSLDQKKFVGAVLMDLSKAFDSISYALLLGKLHAHGFSIDAVTFFYSYLKRRNQNVKINNTHSVFQVLLSGVLQGSILGPFLFNIFIHDIYLWITKTDLLMATLQVQLKKP